MARARRQVLVRATLAQRKGSVKDVQGVLGHSTPHTTMNVYMQEIEAGVKQTLEAIYSELTSGPKQGSSVVKGKNLVRFGTVGILDGRQVIDWQGLGA